MSGTSPASNYFTTGDGLRLYFETRGEGDKALIIPNGVCLGEEFAGLAKGRRVIIYDVRNRGLSETVTDGAKLARGILNDVDDLDALRRHLGCESIDLLGHSYLGFLVALYAMRYPEHVNRVVQIGPVQPHAETKYPPHLAYADGVTAEVLQKLPALQQGAANADPVETCRKFWEVLRPLYVFQPENASTLDWVRCDLPNERNFMPYWTRHVVPSLQQLHFAPEDFARAIAPVLTIHGDKDRSAPYGGGREWAMRLPNAKLLTIRDAAHAPWIEAPRIVLPAIKTFLAGDWPEGAEEITVVDPEL